MDYDNVSGPELGHALRAISVNLLCRDVMAEVAFLTTVTRRPAATFSHAARAPPPPASWSTRLR